MLSRDADDSLTLPPLGRGQLWAAALCIGLSHLMGALWLWSLVWAHPIG